MGSWFMTVYDSLCWFMFTTSYMYNYLYISNQLFINPKVNPNSRSISYEPQRLTLRKLWTMDGPSMDDSPIEHGDFPFANCELARGYPNDDQLGFTTGVL